MGRNIFGHAHLVSLRIKDDSEDIDIKTVFVPQTLTRIGRHAPPSAMERTKMERIELMLRFACFDQRDISRIHPSIFWELSNTFALVQAGLRMRASGLRR